MARRNRETETEGADYADILNRSFEDLDKEKLLPVGGYLLKGKSASLFPPREEGQSARMVFFYTVKEPMDNVDETELAALGEGYDFGENEVSYQIWVEKGRDWAKVRKHLAKHGLDVSDKVTIADALKEFRGTEVAGEIDLDTYTTQAGDEETKNKIVAVSAVE